MLDPAYRTLTYARAGHNPPRLARDGRVISLEGHGGLPLGILGEKGYGQSTIVLEPGDLLLLYTDGITEAAAPTKAGEDRQLFGLERLDAILLECPLKSPAECLCQIQKRSPAFLERPSRRMIKRCWRFGAGEGSGCQGSGFREKLGRKPDSGRSSI